MQVLCSAGVECEFPDLRPLLDDVKGLIRSIDGNVRVRDLLVETRLSPSQEAFNGWAHPEIFSVRRGQFRSHNSGWIQMSLGVECSERDIIRLFAHEMRHISQMKLSRLHPGACAGNVDY